MKLVQNNLEIEIRAGTVQDTPLIMSFIKSMAEFEKLQVRATEEILRESLFSDHPTAYTLLAFVNEQPIAYAVYFFTFSTMVGKRGFWLDDLFVSPEFRGKGIGKAVMSYLAEIAIQNDCERFEWMVLNWNKPAIDFYKALDVTILSEWQLCRLDNKRIINLYASRNYIIN